MSPKATAATRADEARQSAAPGDVATASTPASVCDGAATATEPAPGGPAATARTLLLVEDEASVAAVVAGLLEAAGHRVVVAPHALAALAQVATTAFDAALLDLDLPGVDGLTLAGLLRAQGFNAPLLAVTARHAAGDADAARAAGFDDYLRKPVTRRQLEASLAAAWRVRPGAASPDATAGDTGAHGPQAGA